ncbi:hypothetical protein A6302_02779 [Methylobrevis pamukkalensis]|uniref:Uncharacterized protein n=1 Tax=Methylobrevis pamukkalensis TaxID=1439726 RepID=A0A1E3H0R0_9HYPH|nr:hypothetical protein A6302_02779 [Methylobrevis pamukkalensis]
MHGRDRDPSDDPPRWWTWAIIAAWLLIGARIIWEITT